MIKIKFNFILSIKMKVNFICDICKTGFKTEYLYNKHKNKKIKCVDDYKIYLNNEILKVENIIKEKDRCMEKINERICSYCKIEYKHR